MIKAFIELTLFLFQREDKMAKNHFRYDNNYWKFNLDLF